MSAVYAHPTSGNENGFVTHCVESIKLGWSIHLPKDADPVGDILYVDDLSRACQAFIDSSQVSGLYNLGGGKNNAASLRDIISRIGRMIELQPVIEEDPTIPVPLNYVSDLTRIKSDLGFEPQIGIDEGLRNLL